jgi:hypothetical protein
LIEIESDGTVRIIDASGAPLDAIQADDRGGAGRSFHDSKSRNDTLARHLLEENFDALADYDPLRVNA